MTLHKTPTFQRPFALRPLLVCGLAALPWLVTMPLAVTPQLAYSQAAAGNKALDLLLEQAKTRLQNNQNAEALQSAQQAVTQAGNDYRSHYYLALALMALQRFPEAQATANRAQALAPANAKGAVQALTAEIAKRSGGGQLVEEAQRAANDGLSAKAARLFEQAWQASPDRPELGLKAADLYRDALSMPIDAGRVLWQVANAHPGKPPGQLARDQVAKLQGQLDNQARAWLAEAERQEPVEALKTLDKAEAIAPNLPQLPMARLLASGRGTDLAAVQSAFKGLARNKQASLDNLGKMPRLPEWLKVDAFTVFLDDLFGPEFARKVRQIPEAQAEKQRQFEQRLVKWEVARKEMADQYEKDKVEYQACVSEQHRDYMACIKDIPGTSLLSNSRTWNHVEADRRACRKQYNDGNCDKPEYPKYPPRPTPD